LNSQVLKSEELKLFLAKAMPHQARLPRHELSLRKELSLIDLELSIA
jgi:hypothetical protein